MKMINRMTLRSKLLVLVLATLTISLACVGVFFQSRFHRMAREGAHQQAMAAAERMAATARFELEQALGFTRAMAQMLSQPLGADTVAPLQFYTEILRNQAQRNPQLLALWADLPHAEGQLISAMNTPLGVAVSHDRAETLEFLSPGYTQAKRLKQELILEPHFFAPDGVNRILVTNISVPIPTGGMVGVTLGLTGFRALLDQAKPLPDATFALLSAQGQVIAHSNDFYSGKGYLEIYPGKELEHFITERIRRGSAYSFQWQAQEGVDHLGALAPITVGQTHWAVELGIPQARLVESSAQNIWLWILAMALMLSLLGLVVWRLADGVSKPLAQLREVVDALAQGDIDRSRVLSIRTGDEIEQVGQSVNRLIEGLNQAESFAKEIGKGNLDSQFQAQGEKDILGLSLLEMQKSLKHALEFEAERMVEEKKQSWTNQGIAMFSEILRQNNDNLNELSYGIIQSLVKYTESNQGGIFIINDADSDHRQLEMTACFAYDRRRFMQTAIEPGEGLVGRCYLEGKTIFLTEVPDDYIKITSGLGLARPRCLLIVPLKLNESTLGVLEIASFKVYEKHQVEFIERVAESVASTLTSVRMNIKTGQLLGRSQQQAEELAAQEEEMRQNMEELQATNEQLEVLRLNIERQQRMLINVLNEIPEKIFLKDDQGRYLLANKLVADNYGKTVEEILGKSDFDFYPEPEAKEYFRREQEIIRDGKPVSYEEGDASRYDGLIVRSLKKPFYIEHLGVTGLLGVQFDISEIKRREYQANLMAQEISEKQVELQKITDNLAKEIALMDALMENIPDSIYFKDLESRFIRISWNQAKIFGVGRVEELIGKSDFDIFTEEHARPAYEDEQQIIRTGVPIIDKIEKETYEDGRVAYVSTTKMPLRDKNGITIGTFGISRNITHLMEMELRAKQMVGDVESTHRIIDGIALRTPVLLYRVDGEGLVTEIKGAGLTLMGRESAALVRQPFTALFPSSKTLFEKGIEPTMEFTDTGVWEGRAWAMHHVLFVNPTVEGELLGYAYQQGLV